MLIFPQSGIKRKLSLSFLLFIQQGGRNGKSLQSNCWPFSRNLGSHNNIRLATFCRAEWCSILSRMQPKRSSRRVSNGAWKKKVISAFSADCRLWKAKPDGRMKRWRRVEGWKRRSFLSISPAAQSSSDPETSCSTPLRTG